GGDPRNGRHRPCPETPRRASVRRADRPPDAGSSRGLGPAGAALTGRVWANAAGQEGSAPPGMTLADTEALLGGPAAVARIGCRAGERSELGPWRRVAPT